MTNEEFEGHLMSALVGPNGPAIAQRIISLAGVPEALVEIGQLAFWNAVLHHLDGLKNRSGGDARAAMRLAAATVGAREEVRTRLRKSIHAAKRHDLFVDFSLDPKDPSE